MSTKSKTAKKVIVKDTETKTETPKVETIETAPLEVTNLELPPEDETPKVETVVEAIETPKVEAIETPKTKRGRGRPKGSTINPDETPEARFSRLGTARLSKALHSLETIANLGRNRNRYRFTRGQADVLLNSLRKKVEQIEQCFLGNAEEDQQIVL